MKWLLNYSALLLFLFLLSCNSGLSEIAKPSAVITETTAELTANEITAQTTAWGKDNENGIAYQLLLPKTHQTISTKTRSLPLTVWIKNNTNETKEVLDISPFYNPHGSIEVLNEAGENIINRGCMKKHAYEKIDLASGTMRGFQCDAFKQPCSKLDSTKLKAGIYRLRLKNAPEVTFKVIQSLF